MTDSKCCPECVHDKVLWDFACHTYGTPEQGFYACMPCDSAIRYHCEADECSWDYTEGLNTRNPRAEHNETRRPPWLPTGRLRNCSMGVISAIEGTYDAWGDDDE